MSTTETNMVSESTKTTQSKLKVAIFGGRSEVEADKTTTLVAVTPTILSASTGVTVHLDMLVMQDGEEARKSSTPMMKKAVEGVIEKAYPDAKVVVEVNNPSAKPLGRIRKLAGTDYDIENMWEVYGDVVKFDEYAKSLVKHSRTLDTKSLFTELLDKDKDKVITTLVVDFLKNSGLVEEALENFENSTKERLSAYSVEGVEELTKEEEKELEELLKSELGFRTLKYMFKKHVLIEGEKGSGKTYTVSRVSHLMRLNTIFTAGHESMESIDLLGHLIPTSGGELVWKDGPLTEAFRNAASGVPTVLFVDEVLRIPQRELNIMVGSLSPDAQGMYTIRTGRVKGVTPEGVAVEETIRVPQNMLWVVGTTNVGAGYSVDEIDEALADRFRIIRKDTSVEEAKTILAKNAQQVGFSEKDGSKVITKLMKFFTMMKEMMNSGDLNKIVNQRHLSEAVLLSEGSEEILKQNLVDLVLNWIDRDSSGYPMATQQDLVMKTIARVFA